MIKRFLWALRCGILALFFTLLPAADLTAQQQPAPGPSAMQEKVAPPQPAVTPSDSITVPDGTPLTLQLVSALSSGSAKVGDTVQFNISNPLLINGLVVMPKGTALSGTVAHVSHPHRLSSNGEVRVTVEKMILPGGDIVPLRLSKSASAKPKSMPVKRSSGPCDVSCGDAGAAGLIILPMILFSKGEEQVYPAGTQTTAYVNGTLHLDRAVLPKFQPAPYKGPAEIFFTNYRTRNRELSDSLFSDQTLIGRLAVPLQLKLNPGSYTFSAVRGPGWTTRPRHAKAYTVQLEVQDDHQYWIAREPHGLFIKDLQQHQGEFDMVQNDSGTIGKDCAISSGQESCPQAIHPSSAALPPSASPHKP